MTRAPLVVLGFSWLLVGCGGASETATKNRTFYDWTVGAGSSSGQLEQRYPPLDLAEAQPNPEYLGVTIVRGGVHLSRPKNWMIREAGNDPGNAYIQYVSPKAYAVGIYERPDSPRDTWRDILVRYEDDVASSAGAKVVGQRAPVAVWRGQGRAYSIERKVDAAKRAFVSHSREILVRGEHRIVLVQIVHDGEDFSAIDQELMRVVTTLEVL